MEVGAVLARSLMSIEIAVSQFTEMGGYYGTRHGAGKGATLCQLGSELWSGPSMATILVIATILLVVSLGWLAMIAVRGNNYHAQVLRSVTAELGSMATPYLEARPFVEQIKAAFRRGDPPRSAALALILIIREAESEKNSS